MLIEIGALAITTGLFGYWTMANDKNAKKLKQLFMACGIQIDDKYPIFKGKSGQTYMFKLPKGLSFDDDFMSNEKAIKDAFYPRPVLFSFSGLVLITIGDPLPRRMDVPEEKGEGFKIPLGRGVLGEVFHDFDKIPHLLVAGITRYGKTVLLELLIYSILRQTPKKAKFALLDLKGGLSFNKFKNLTQTISMAHDIESSQKLLETIEKEVILRQELFLANGIEKIQQMPKLERIFVIIDEAAQLTSDGLSGEEAREHKKCERKLAYIAQVGAGLGIHLVYCTQYPTSKTLPPQVKQNCDATISFRLRNDIADRVVFDDVDKASKLPFLPGRAIYRSDKESELQVYYVSEKKLRDMIAEHSKGGSIVELVNAEGNEGGKNTPDVEGLDIFDSETTSEGN